MAALKGWAPSRPYEKNMSLPPPLFSARQIQLAPPRGLTPTSLILDEEPPGHSSTSHLGNRCSVVFQEHFDTAIGTRDRIPAHR